MQNYFFDTIAGIFNGPDIRKLMKNTQFDEYLSDDEALAWDGVKAVIENVLGKRRAENYKVLVDDLMTSFKNIGVHMSLKIHFMNSHMDYFGRQLETESDEHGERFHQEIMHMEERYKGKKLDRTLADFCWATHEIDYDTGED